MFNPRNFAHISKYKIMIMISILKWQANPFLSYIIFQLIATDNICRQGSVFGCKIESHSHVLWIIHVQNSPMIWLLFTCWYSPENMLAWFSHHLNLVFKNSLHLKYLLYTEILVPLLFLRSQDIYKIHH